MFHRASGLGEHDIPQAGIVRTGGAVGDGEVLARIIAIHEDGDVVYFGGAVLWIRRQPEPTVGGDIEGNLYLFCRTQPTKGLSMRFCS